MSSGVNLGSSEMARAPGKRDHAEGAVARREGHRGRTAQHVAGFQFIDVLVDQVGLHQHFFDEVDAALGLAGGAGGEQDDPDVVGIQFDVGELIRRRRHLFAEGDAAFGFPVFGLAAHHDDLGGELEFVPGFFHGGHQGETYRKGGEFGVIADESHFFLGPQGRNGYRDGAAFLDAKIDGHGFRHVGQAEAYPVLGPDALLGEDVGELVGHGQQFFKGDLLVPKQDGDLVAAAFFHMLVKKFFRNIPLS